MKQTIERDINPLDYEFVEMNLKHLQGQVLTFIEAAMPGNESAKSVIKGYFNEKLTWIFSLYGISEKEVPEYTK